MPNKHKQVVEGDEIACSCGLRWGKGEDDPHLEVVVEYHVHYDISKVIVVENDPKIAYLIAVTLMARTDTFVVWVSTPTGDHNLILPLDELVKLF